METFSQRFSADHAIPHALEGENSAEPEETSASITGKGRGTAVFSSAVQSIAGTPEGWRVSRRPE